MKKKRIRIVIACIVAIWAITGIVDFALVQNYHKPIFCVGVDLADDGGSGRYVGLGHSFDLEGNFMPEAEDPGITSYRGYLFGQEICRGFWEEVLPGPEAEPAVTGGEDPVPQPEDSIVAKPPTLMIYCGEASTEALRGGYSWDVLQKDGTMLSEIADSMHTLDCQEYMDPLHFIPSVYSSLEPYRATLQFSTVPDAVSVRCWSGDSWGNYEADSEEIQVRILEVDASVPMDEQVLVTLKPGNFIYEVKAEWNHSEEWGGEVYYSFYTLDILSEQELCGYPLAEDE